MPIQTLEPTPAHKRLRLFSLIGSALGLLQLLIAVTFMITDVEALSRVHEIVALLLVAAAVLAAIPAYAWGTMSRDRGLFPHAAGLAAATVIQIVIGFAFAPKEGEPYGPLMNVHFVLGVLIALGMFFLYYKARQMPVIVTAVEEKPSDKA